MNVKGKVAVVMETMKFDSGFQKREFVVETEEQYPQKIKMEFTKDKCSLLDSVKVGDSVDVSINLKGNEYNGKYYVNLQAWKIEQLVSTEPTAGLPPMGSFEEETEDLPF
jgi:hypothetical protein